MPLSPAKIDLLIHKIAQHILTADDGCLRKNNNTYNGVEIKSQVDTIVFLVMFITNIRRPEAFHEPKYRQK